MELAHLDLANLTGRGFSLAEQTALRQGTTTLLAKAKQQAVLVWGKVYGHRADYVIVTCFGTDPIGPDATHFFSTDGGVTFTLLPEPTNLQPPLAATQPEGAKEPVVPVTTMTLCGSPAMSGCVFMGEPAYEYVAVDAVSGCAFRIKEAERLACFVALHGSKCRAVPRGAVCRVEAPLGADVDNKAKGFFGIRANAGFTGLSRDAAGKLSSYVHLRADVRPRSELEKEGVATSLDFLDPVSEDVPAGCWNLKYQQTEDVVFGVSQWLPGAVFYHRPGTKLFGSVYVGDGAVAHDLPFML